MKRINHVIALFMAIILTFSLIPVSVIAKSETEGGEASTEPLVSLLTNKASTSLIEGLVGSGTENDPVLINTVSDWLLFAKSVDATGKYQGKYFRLVNDLDFSTYTDDHSNLVVGGTKNNKPPYSFGGFFDGNGKTIKNLRLVGSNLRAGLFGQLTDAWIENLNIVDMTVTQTSSSYTGGITAVVQPGDAGKYTCIRNCTVSNLKIIHQDVKDQLSVYAGIVAFAQSNLKIENCTVENVTLVENKCKNARTPVFGGILGSINHGAECSLMIDGCSVTGNIEVTTNDAGNKENYLFIGGAVGFINTAEESIHMISNTKVDIGVKLNLTVDRSDDYIGSGNGLFGIGGLIGLLGHSRGQIAVVSGCEVKMDLNVNASPNCSIAESRMGGVVADMLNSSYLIINETKYSAVADGKKINWIGYYNLASTRAITGASGVTEIFDPAA